MKKLVRSKHLLYNRRTILGLISTLSLFRADDVVTKQIHFICAFISYGKLNSPAVGSPESRNFRKETAYGMSSRHPDASQT